MEYKGRGHYLLNGEDRFATQIGLICGGTGLTPAYQVMQAVCKDPDDTTEIFLLYGNRTEKDILLREELDRMGKRVNVHVWYTLDTPSEGWEYSSGFVTRDMIADHIPDPGPNTIVGMCGPLPMVNFACVPNLKALAFQESQYFSF